MRILILIILLMTAALLFAEDNYDQLKNDGVEFYKQGEYQQAYDMWNNIPESYHDYKTIDAYKKNALFEINESKKLKQPEVNEVGEKTSLSNSNKSNGTIKSEEHFPEQNIQQEKKVSSIPDKTDSQSQKPDSIKLLLNIETGGGDMVSTYCSVKLPQLKRFQFGLGGAFTYNEEEYFGVKYDEYYHTLGGLVSFNLLRHNSIWLDLRERIGMQFITIDTYKESGLLLSTDLMIGFKYFYGEVAMPVFFGREGTAIFIRMGVGAQLELF